MLSPLQPVRWLDIIRQHCKCSCQRIVNRWFVSLSSNAFRTLEIGQIPVSDLWSRKLNLIRCIAMSTLFFSFHFVYPFYVRCDQMKRVRKKGHMFLIRFFFLLFCCHSIPARIRIDAVHIPNQIELFSLSQCSSSGRILMSSSVDNGFSSGNVSSRRCSGSLNCHVNKITKSIDSSPATIVYSFHGSTFFCSIEIENENKWNWNANQKKIQTKKQTKLIKRNPTQISSN